MEREDIVEYLKMLEAPPKTWKNFLKAMRLSDGPNAAKKVTRFPVKINRSVESELHRFSDYFRGFDKVESVREVLGDSADDILADLKVEFVDFRFPSIIPSEDDGHLIVTSDYFRTGKTGSIYLDAFLCLALQKTLPPAGGRGGGAQPTDDPATFDAYAAMVKEARRMGLTDGEVMDHLQMMRFVMPSKAFSIFLKRLKVSQGR